MSAPIVDFAQRYPLPPRGQGRYAYTTFLLFNLSQRYVASSMLMAYALRQQDTVADLVCMVTPGMPRWARQGLEALWDTIVEVPPVFIPHPRRHHRPDIPFLFTRFHALRLGPDGDLGFDYDKVVVLDADVLPLRRYDHLFTLPAPAGIINEDKSTFRDYDADGRYIIPPSVYQDGTWNWHRVYGPLCPHGSTIPAEITDRPATDPENLGIIGAFFVLPTSQATFDDIMADVERPEIAALVGGAFSLPDMQYLTMYWSGQWTSVDLRFCALSGYPMLGVLCGTHYAGAIKPWSLKKPAALARYGRYEDFQHWYRLYLQMLDDYPDLRHINRFADLETTARDLLRQR